MSVSELNDNSLLSYRQAYSATLKSFLRRLVSRQLVEGTGPSGQSQLNEAMDQRTSSFMIKAIVMLALVAVSMVLTPAYAAGNAKVGQRILMIEMAPALCSIYPSRAKMRQCLEGYSLTVSGLDLGYGDRCGRGGSADLTPLQLRVVNKVMPDATVRDQAWRRYGACSPLRSSFYFRQIVTHASDLKLPRELNTGNSYTVSKTRFLSQLIRLNPGMTSSGVDLICQDAKRRQSVLTEIHICYQGNNFGSCPSVVDNCGSNFIISGGK